MISTISLEQYLSSSEHKFSKYRQLWAQVERKEILTDFPMHLDIELSGFCNLKCESCFQNGLITQPLGLMDVNLFRKIIDEGVPKGLCAIKLQIRGESFLHPELFDCIRYAKDAGVMDIQITTNATLLERSLKTFDSGLDGIIFSIDDHHSKALQGKGHTYSEVELNIKNFLNLRGELNRRRPWVRIQSSIPIVNYRTLNRTREYIRDKFPGVDVILVNRIHNFKDDEDSYPDLHTNYKLLPCNNLFQRIAIFWDGSITICCMDYNNKFKLGNINNQSVQEIWLSEKMQEFRETHLSGGRSNMNICKHCHVSTKGAHMDFDQSPLSDGKGGNGED